MHRNFINFHTCVERLVKNDLGDKDTGFFVADMSKLVKKFANLLLPGH